MSIKLRTGSLAYGSRMVSHVTGVLSHKDKWPSKTIQSGKDDADINIIIRRFGVTRVLPTGLNPPSYGDYDTVMDFKSAMNAIRGAEETFMQLPSAVRKRFGNDPQEFLRFAGNPENIDDMRKMGLAIPKKDDIIPPVDNIVPRETRENEDERDDQRNERRSASRTGKTADENRRPKKDSRGE